MPNSNNILLLDIKNNIATITFNRPNKRNPLTREMGERLVEAIDKISANDDVRVVIFTGAGKAFSAGGDLDLLLENTKKTHQENKSYMNRFYRLYLNILKIEVPTIAMINGAAIGAGLCIALACDMRIASRKARMGVNFVKIGLHPGMGGTYNLPRIVGVERAFDLFCTGRIIDGKEAEAIGLVGRAVAAERLSEVTYALANDIASSAPIAVKQVKRGIYHGASTNLEDALDYEADSQATCFSTKDVVEGINAVKEKRPPKFKGK